MRFLFFTKKGYSLEIWAKNCDVSYGRSLIVEDLNFSAKSGDMVAILGPSGAGKSTIFNLFFGDAKCEKGSFGAADKDGKIDFKKICLVTQDDVLINEFSVYDNLKYYAKLHDEDTSQIVSILKELDIEHISKSRIYKNGKCQISGGQRKRVNIALELLLRTNKVFFVDEPTSGLSTKDSLGVVEALQRIAKGKKDDESLKKEDDKSSKKIVLAIIHQPSLEILRYFDKILLYSKTDKKSPAKASLMSLEDFEYSLANDTLLPQTTKYKNIHEKYNEFLKSI